MDGTTTQRSSEKKKDSNMERDGRERGRMSEYNVDTLACFRTQSRENDVPKQLWNSADIDVSRPNLSDHITEGPYIIASMCGTIMSGFKYLLAGNN